MKIYFRIWKFQQIYFLYITYYWNSILIIYIYFLHIFTYSTYSMGYILENENKFATINVKLINRALF